MRKHVIIEKQTMNLFSHLASFSRADAASSSSEGALGSIVNVLSAFRNARTHKMIFVANMSLKMGAGKLAAQVGHATLAVYRLAQRSAEVSKI